MQSALAAFDAESERILLELETVRGELLTPGEEDAGVRAPGASTPSDASRKASVAQLASLQDELDTLAERMSVAGEDHTT